MAIRLLRLLYAAIGVSILIAPIVAPPIVAQTTSGLRGQVADESGAVIPGAQISLIDARGKQRNAVAGPSGEFVIPIVVPGTYTLRVSFKGFDTYVNNAVEVTASSSAPLKITLKIQPVNAETEVTANGAGVSVEPDQNMNVTVLDEDFIQTLPDNEDDLRDFLQALAGPAAGGAMVVRAELRSMSMGSKAAGFRHVMRFFRSVSIRIRSRPSLHIPASAVLTSSQNRGATNGMAAGHLVCSIRRSMRAMPLPSKSPNWTSRDIPFF
jgi:hypothetical protein